MTSPRVACIIPWRNTDETERIRNLAFTRSYYEAVSLDIEPLNVVFPDSGAVVFDRGGSRNHGAAITKEPYLLFADADTVVPYAQITAGLALLEQHPQRWVILYGLDRYYNLTENATADLVAAGAKITNLAEPVEGEWVHKLTSWAGALLLPRAAFEAAGGYDPRFGRLGWGFEDNAFVDAVDTMWGHHVRTDGYALHLWHPRGLDFDGPWIPESQKLARRYSRARGRKPLMSNLIAEGARS